jgi:tRNA pseudouridine55 synthase
MARRKGDAVHGWLILDKPLGLTSTKALSIARRILNANKAGHAGTLDPLASGVLPLAFGEATKTVPYLVEARKTYRFTVGWGAETATDDTEGDVTRQSEKRPSAEEVLRALPEFVGRIMQTPPAFSAVKVDGERAYDLARDGEDVQLAPRAAHIHRLELADVPDPGHGVFEMVCGKGTYVRAFARDLGRALGCFGHVKALTRLGVGPFTLNSAISLEKLEESATDGAAKRFLMPLATALDDIPGLAVTDQEAAHLRLGQAILARGRVSLREEAIAEGEGALPPPVYCRSRTGDPVAIAQFERGELRPTRVFNFSTRG